MERESRRPGEGDGSEIFTAEDTRSHSKNSEIPQRIIRTHWLREPEMAVLP